jgi:ribosome-associated protein
MTRTDEAPRQPGQVDGDRPTSKGLPALPSGQDGVADSAHPLPSKTQRKAAMHALQDLGETLVALSPDRLSSLSLPERLEDAVAQAREITKWEARRRQMQFIGRLMRDVDPEPIRARIAEWNGASRAEKARLAAVERWRERLIQDAEALDRLCAEAPHADRSRFAALIGRVRSERAANAPPHAYRELFRALNSLFSASA